jgi:hypothetical protein
VGLYGPKSYNVDINQLGTSQLPRFSISNDAPYKDGLVEDVILNESHPEYSPDFGTNIGMVRVRMIPDDRGSAKEFLNWAMPLDTSIREYPLKNEMVLVFYSIGRLFYTRRININNKITENSWPGLSSQFSASPNSENRTAEIVAASQGGPAYRPWGERQSDSLGDEFTENPTVKMVRPNEGDMIIQGRYGNIIRMGSSLFSNPLTTTPEPNLLLTVGQSSNKVGSTKNNSPYTLVYEDINSDKSCIWMVTDEKITLNPATKDTNAHLRSAEVADSTKYTGAQIFINSDRIVLNSKLNEISLFSNTEINLSAVQSITVDSNKTIQMTAVTDVKIQAENDIFLKGKTLSFVTTGVAPMGDISFATSENYIISAKKIFIGSGGDETQPMVLGGNLQQLLYDLIRALSTATVITSTGPAFFNPQVSTSLTNLLSKVGIPGRPTTADFNSESNFTSKTNS